MAIFEGHKRRGISVALYPLGDYLGDAVAAAPPKFFRAQSVKAHMDLVAHFADDGDEFGRLIYAQNDDDDDCLHVAGATAVAKRGFLHRLYRRTGT